MITRTFHTKRDAEDWARRTEDEMARGAVLQPGGQHSQTDTGKGRDPMNSALLKRRSVDTHL